MSAIHPAARAAIVSATLLLGLAALAPVAGAWTHTGDIWLSDAFPIRYWVADSGDSPSSVDRCNSSGQLEGCCEESVPAGYCRQAAAEGFDAWHAAQCAEFSVEDQGICPNIDRAADSKYYITFNDPGKNVEAGVLAVTYPSAFGDAKIIDGQQYKEFYEADIVFNDLVDFTTHEIVEAGGQCSTQINMRDVMTHEIGHSLGMGHSCEDPNKEGGGPCPDPVLRDATMFWQEGACQTSAATINDDDIEGINALYGPFASFTCSHQVEDGLSVGVVPFDLNCVIVSDYLNEVVSADWNFGDGGTSDDPLAATHTYTEPGNYTIQLEVHGEREACGPDGWENNFRRVGYVRACGVPTSEFEVEHIDGLQYKMLNESDVSVYGCISNIDWTVYEGEGTGGTVVQENIQAWEPIIEFPDNGTYTVVMNLGGIGGTGASMVTFTARNTRGEGRGCATGAAPIGGGAGVLLALGLVAARRRR